MHWRLFPLPTTKSVTMNLLTTYPTSPNLFLESQEYQRVSVRLSRCCRKKLEVANFFMHTAISRKVVGESARDNPERYCGWF